MGRRRTLNRHDYRGDYEEEETDKEEEGEEEAEEEEEAEGEEEEAEADGDEEASDEDDEESPKSLKKAKKKATSTKRRTTKTVRLKAVWVVFDNASKQIETFPYNQKAEAEAFVEAKNTDKKGAYYLQMLKVPLDS